MSNKVLVLGCNYDQVPFIQEIKNRGFFVVGTDVNKNAPGKAFCDKFYNIAYDAADSIIELGYKEAFSSADKVFSAAAQFSYISASKFANEFGIAFPKVEDIEICLDKKKYYNLFQMLNVPIPETHFVADESDLTKVLDMFSDETNFYLKSDFSKNPHHVYRFSKASMNTVDIFWGRDRYLQECYILQEEFIGEHLRVNVFGDRFNVFSFDIQKTPVIEKPYLVEIKVIEALKRITNTLGLSNFLVKFDIIVNDKTGKFCVLDIGLDVPYRMRKYYFNNQKSFENDYVSHYLFGENCYEEIG